MPLSSKPTALFTKALQDQCLYSRLTRRWRLALNLKLRRRLKLTLRRSPGSLCEPRPSLKLRLLLRPYLHLVFNKNLKSKLKIKI